MPQQTQNWSDDFDNEIKYDYYLVLKGDSNRFVYPYEMPVAEEEIRFSVTFAPIPEYMIMDMDHAIDLTKQRFPMIQHIDIEHCFDLSSGAIRWHLVGKIRKEDTEAFADKYCTEWEKLEANGFNYDSVYDEDDGDDGDNDTPFYDAEV